HVRQPGGRVVQLQRQVRRAGPQDREQGGDHVGRARQRQRDDPLGGGPAGQEQAGDAVDALVQLGVGEGLVLGDDGGRAGGARRLRGEHLRDRLVGQRAEGGVPLGGQGPPFPRLQRVERARARRRAAVPRAVLE